MALRNRIFSQLSSICILAVATACAGCGSGNLDSACAALADASCSKSRECYGAELFPHDYCEQRYLTICQAYYGPDGGNAAPSAIQACAEATGAQSCADLGKPIDACIIAGSKAAGEPCSMGFECQSTACKKDIGKECGTCAAAAPEPGDPCGDDPAICASSGLYCSSTTAKCIASGGVGDPCSPTAPCSYAYRCGSDGKCALRLPEGSACDPSGYDCAFGTMCNGVTNKCEKYVVAHVGEPCGIDSATDTSRLCTMDTICQSDPGTSDLVCLAPAKEGDPCSEAYPACELGASCHGGVCTTEPLSCE